MASKGKIDRYPDVQEVVVTGKRRSLLDKYEDASVENPKTKLALDLLPGTGQITSVIDSANSARKGNYVDAAVDLAGVLPPVKWVSKAVKATKAKKLYRNLKELDSVGDTQEFAKKEGETERMARGGMVKSRGNGIAQRGKTKGKMR